MISNRDKRHIARAGFLARVSTERYKHGCVIVRGGRVIGVGVNTFRNNPNNVEHPKQEASYHAETNAMRGLDVTGATIYVSRINAAKELTLSAPCFNCLERIKLSGAKRVVWSVDARTIYDLIL